MDVRFRPLDRWLLPPTPVDERRSKWTFKASWNETLALLEDELHRLDARDVVIEAGFRSEDIRLDGWPRSGACPTHPGIALSFECRYGPLRYMTDRHEFWQHNLRAIALGLQALRAVDRYGITHRAEQYKGWAALPSGAAGDLNGWKLSTKGEAERLLVDLVGDGAEGLDVGALYKRALIRAHPDHGGSREQMEAVKAAAALLGVG